MSKRNGTIIRFILLERKSGSVSQHYSVEYDLTDDCDVALFQDDANRIASEPRKASNLDCFAPGKDG